MNKRLLLVITIISIFMMGFIMCVNNFYFDKPKIKHYHIYNSADKGLKVRYEFCITNVVKIEKFGSNLRMVRLHNDTFCLLDNSKTNNWLYNEVKKCNCK